MPAAAYPLADRVNRAKHSYTVEDQSSGARIEVLLRARAFFVKKLGPEAPADSTLGHVSWKGDVQTAWSEAKCWAGFS